MMKDKVINYIKDNRLMLLIIITIAIGISTVTLAYSFVFQSKVKSGEYIIDTNTK